MAVQKYNQGWLISIGVMVTLLWASQLSADWFQPHNEIEFAQHSKTELATFIQHESSGTSRVFRLENKPDPSALTSNFSVLALSGLKLWLTPFALTSVYISQTPGLPGIRAPPQHYSSA
jgi:hypothetical protein